MNQDKVKEILISIQEPLEDFSVVFTGKKSKKVHGLYKPESREILIHNQNFTEDHGLLYTAIHEYAHHIHFTSSDKPVSSRSHTDKFHSILHSLIVKAEKNGIYASPFDSDQRFLELTEKIKNEFLSKNGELMQEFGTVLMEAQRLCKETETSFDDYVDRVLGLHHTSAKSIMQVSTMNFDPAIGFENMQVLSRIKDPRMREEAEAAVREGASQQMVKTSYGTKPKEKSKREELSSERRRIERTLQRLQSRLEEIDTEMQELNLDEE
ncbi:MAG: hypothetical protein ACLFR1_00715 [Spirochaetia bacterium]